MVTKTMELKDVILSTLAEMDDVVEQEESKAKQDIQESLQEDVKETIQERDTVSDEEERYLKNIRERLLVLFEGFQSPNNSQIEAKVDLTLNFLEYLLATIEARLEKIK